MKRNTTRALSLSKWLENAGAARGYSSLSERLYEDLTSRRIPLSFDYLHPQQSHLLELSLTNLLCKPGSFSQTQHVLPTIARPSLLPPAHHLVYFPPQVTLPQLLRDGTDTLHCPGAPFNRRLWAGGSVNFARTNKLRLDGSRAVCIERIRDVILKGQPGEEKIVVKIERHIGSVREDETEHDVRQRFWSSGQDANENTSVIEYRDLVFMRDKTAEKLDEDKANFSQTPRMIKSPPNPEFRYSLTPTKALLFRFSALTFNAHLIHLDQGYTRDVEGYRNLLVHGPLTLTLLLTALRRHLGEKNMALQSIDYKNLSPLYVEEELTICGKPKPNRDTAWDVWIEGKNGGVAVRGTAHVDAPTGDD
ncbi:hypothetical protein BDV18DRAFT_160873 [Aspergillus unguis]